ncbi:hypothetical protein [Acetohalobium arabaticum]|uniref:hypothetical protein n=1 Tax=Acetohalobium arabaticum TaxID=28187 RepID=UPI0002E2A376|nr:hypothetical protein [Acetohalobium arabaticum]
MQKEEINNEKISIVLALVLIVTMAVPAMALEFQKGKMKVENKYKDVDDSNEDGSGTKAKTYLFLKQQVDKQVSIFTLLRVDYDFANQKSTETKTFIRKGWINVENAVGPLDFRAGRLDEAAANNLLYDMERKYEFARATYDSKDFAIKAGHSFEDKNAGKIFFTEAKAKNLGLFETVTLNYVDNNELAYEGYSVASAKEFGVANLDFTYGDADNDADDLTSNAK